nr:N-acetylglucosamine-6-phosphate deacetylase [uncultured Anaerobutyricum sp.]
MIIDNVKVYTEAGNFVSGGIVTQGDRIIEIYTEAEKEEIFKKMNIEMQHFTTQHTTIKYSVQNGIDNILDGNGAYAIPGLIDLHFHGCMGDDFCDGDKEAIRRIAEYEASVGVTAIAPATMTLPVEELENILKTAVIYKKEYEEELACSDEKFEDESGQEQNTKVKQGNIMDENSTTPKTCEKKKGKKRADFVGINMEGPFISPVKKGAQDERNIIPCNKEVAEKFLDASDNLVKFIGIAPEESDNTISFIKNMKDKVNISLAHTNADYESAKAAFDAGANHAVHLFNAMPAFTHRETGVVGAVSDSEHVMAEIICDGIHIHPSMVRAVFKMMGAERMIFISDSMRATGMPDGQYTLGGLDVKVRGNRATLVSDGALAGSVTNLADCMRTAVTKMRIPLETAIACATKNPAISLGVYDERGSISVGKKADIVLIDKDLVLKTVIKDGSAI